MDQALSSERHMPATVGPCEEEIEVSGVEGELDESHFTLCDQPDESLVAIVATGCTSAFEFLYDRHSPVVFSYWSHQCHGY